MKLLVGLGNPGRRYVATRHNVGFRVAEAFASEHAIKLRRSWRMPVRLGRGEAGDGPIAVLEPLRFMNRSGEVVRAAMKRLRITDPATELAVAYDDLDLPFGRIRVRASGGAGGHRGVEDIIDFLDTRDFIRLRFGIGRPSGGQGITEWVLAPFSPEEEACLPERLATAASALGIALGEGAPAAMNRFNSG